MSDTTTQSQTENVNKTGNNSSNVQQSTDAFAKGLYTLIEPVITEVDVRMQSVLKSQNDLSHQIDLLAEELEKFMKVGSSPSPTLLIPVQTLLRSKQRLIAINNTLNGIKERLDRIEKMAGGTDSQISLGSLFGKLVTPQTPSTRPTTQQPSLIPQAQVAPAAQQSPASPPGTQPEVPSPTPQPTEPTPSTQT